MRVTDAPVVRLNAFAESELPERIRNVIASLRVLTTPIVHADMDLLAAGLSAVVTRESERRRGRATRLAAQATSWMAAQGFDLGSFTSDRPISGVYTAAGWHVLPGAVLVGGTREDPFPSDQPGRDKVVLAEFFSHTARRLRSTFDGAGIALYSGPIDRLW
jgi:aminoglycoside 2'-N-acetyltransferase I